MAQTQQEYLGRAGENPGTVNPDNPSGLRADTVPSAAEQQREGAESLVAPLVAYAVVTGVVSLVTMVNTVYTSYASTSVSRFAEQVSGDATNPLENPSAELFQNPDATLRNRFTSQSANFSTIANRPVGRFSRLL